MIKRKIWCNLCIDLVAFTSEIFKGAVFQSLDGIIVSANCKLRKIFTLKSKPQDTADKDDQFINRATGSVRSCKSQDVCHIAFGSRVLGPPPLSGRRNNLRLSTETVRSVGSKNSRSCQQLTTEKCVKSAEMSTLLISEAEEQGDKENIRQIKQTAPIHANLPIMHPHPPQEASADKNNNRRRFRLKSASRERTETPSGNSGTIINEDEGTTVLTTGIQQRAETLNSSTPGPPSPDQADEWIFPENDDHISHLASGSQSLLDDSSTSHLCLEASKDSERDPQAEETQILPKDIFTFSSRPRSAPHGRTQNLSPEECLFTLDLKEDNSGRRKDTQLEDDFYDGDSSEEEYNWRNYQPSQMSESELQMLASLRRQQKEELEDPGDPHGLSASQVDNCNVSISTSSDDTTTWNSCLPPPVNQGRHYQKEMNPPSPSNPRDWLNMLSPPIVPPSQQPTEPHPDSSGSFSAEGDEDLSVEEDEEVLTLLYDPCLNCYFDPQTGKYYELV
ncbi:protein CFAP20DC isoform 3-T3 [Callospermophilus lateralis]|uniref:protein CFAP20DC isoform X3 n=1 Tax=Callospermophilus lateralis TaxID=76772 RepID=UPI004038B314